MQGCAHVSAASLCSQSRAENNAGIENRKNKKLRGILSADNSLKLSNVPSRSFGEIISRLGGNVNSNFSFRSESDKIKSPASASDEGVDSSTATAHKPTPTRLMGDAGLLWFAGMLSQSAVSTGQTELLRHDHLIQASFTDNSTAHQC